MGVSSSTPVIVLERGDVVAMLDVHAHAIRQAAERVDLPSFQHGVNLVAACQGRVATAGIGTSGIIARKIAATLTSTGTPAHFIHPSDALHGGLGLLDESDIAIIVSNSGETDELLGFLPYLASRKVPCIAIVGNVNSTLARHAHVVLNAFTEQEACPLGLAPTASTSVAMAIGDVLAMSVLSAKGVTAERFVRNHPSGRIGKRLTLTVRDVMPMQDRPSVGLHASLMEVVSAISEGGMGATTVESGSGELVGIITDGDLRRTLERVRPETLPALQASEFMTTNPVIVDAGWRAYDALRMMEDRPSQIAVLPVIHEGSCIGLVRLHDLVQSGI